MREKIKVEKGDMGFYGSNCLSELPAVSQELKRCPRKMCKVQETLPQHQGLHPDINPKPWHTPARVPRPEGTT